MNNNRSWIKWALTAAIFFGEYLILKNSGDAGVGIVVLVSVIGGFLYFRERYPRSGALQGAVRGARRATNDGAVRFIGGLLFVLFLGLFVAPYQFGKMIARRLPAGAPARSAVRSPAPAPAAPAPHPTTSAPRPAAPAPVPPRVYTPPVQATRSYTPHTSAQPARPASSVAAPTATYTPNAAQRNAPNAAFRPAGNPAQRTNSALSKEQRKIQEAIDQMDQADRQPLDREQTEFLKQQLRQSQAQRRALKMKARHPSMSQAQQEALKQRMRSSMAQRRRTGKGSDY